MTKGKIKKAMTERPAASPAAYVFKDDERLEFRFETLSRIFGVQINATSKTTSVKLPGGGRPAWTKFAEERLQMIKEAIGSDKEIESRTIIDIVRNGRKQMIAERDEKIRDQQALRQQLSERDQQLAARDATIEALRQQLSERDQQLAAGDARMRDQQIEMGELQEKIRLQGEQQSKNDAEIQGLKDTVKNVDQNALQTLKNKIDSLYETISTKDAEIQRLKDKADNGAIPTTDAGTRGKTSKSGKALANEKGQQQDPDGTQPGISRSGNGFRVRKGSGKNRFDKWFPTLRQALEALRNYLSKNGKKKKVKKPNAKVKQPNKKK